MRCTIAHNTTESGDGAGMINQGTATIINSTFFGNTAAQNGGALLSVGATTLTNCTITRNTASQEFIRGRTFDGGGGISNFDAQFFASTTLRNTIVADNRSPENPDVAGTITSRGYNLIGDGTGGAINPAIGDQIRHGDLTDQSLASTVGRQWRPDRDLRATERQPSDRQGRARARYQFRSAWPAQAGQRPFSATRPGRE